MAIPCRTGCDEEINYEAREFPDGFVFFLPKNLDGKIHKCKNLHESINQVWSSDTIEGILEQKSEYTKTRYYLDVLTDYEKYVYGFYRYNDNVKPTYPGEFEHVLKKLLINTQMECLLFPDFNSDRIIPDDYEEYKEEYDDAHIESMYLADILEKKGFCIIPSTEEFARGQILLKLGEYYEMSGQFDCAITALMIQHEITNDQMSTINKLMKKLPQQKNPAENKSETSPDKFSDSPTNYAEVQEKFRLFERLLHDFLRRNIPMKEFRNEFPELFDELQRKRELDDQNRIIPTEENDDIFEKLSFGQCVTILIKKRKKAKKSVRNSDTENNEVDVFSKIGSIEIGFLKFILDNFRNPDSHPERAPENLFGQDMLNTVDGMVGLVTHNFKLIEHV